MRQSVILIAICVLLLGGAWLGSHALVPAEPTPAAVPPVAPVVLPGVAPTPVGPQVTPTPAFVPLSNRRDARVANDNSMTAQPATVATGPAPAARVEERPDEEPNPFAGESRELDYADRLLWETDGGSVERLNSAREVFKRCLDAMPESQRCKDGLAAVNTRLTPPKLAPSPLPTLRNDVQNPSLVIPRR